MLTHWPSWCPLWRDCLYWFEDAIHAHIDDDNLSFIVKGGFKSECSLSIMLLSRNSVVYQGSPLPTRAMIGPLLRAQLTAMLTKKVQSAFCLASHCPEFDTDSMAWQLVESPAFNRFVAGTHETVSRLQDSAYDALAKAVGTLCLGAVWSGHGKEPLLTRPWSAL